MSLMVLLLTASHKLFLLYLLSYGLFDGRSLLILSRLILIECLSLLSNWVLLAYLCEETLVRLLRDLLLLLDRRPFY